MTFRFAALIAVYGVALVVGARIPWWGHVWFAVAVAGELWMLRTRRRGIAP